MEIDREEAKGDDADKANYFIESVIDDHVKEAMRRVAEIPTGQPGECDFCGYYYSRLIRGACGGCRDRYKLDQ